MKYVVVCHPKVRNKYYVARQGIGMHFIVAEALGEDVAKQIAERMNAEFHRNEDLLTPAIKPKTPLRAVKKKAA